MIIGMLLIGLILISSAIKGTEHELGQQLQDDILGTGGFLGWIVAIALLGAIGYIPAFTRASKYLIVLLYIVLLVRNPGVFDAAKQGITQAVERGPAPAVAAPEPVTGGTSGGKSSDGPGAALSIVSKVIGM